MATTCKYCKLPEDKQEKPGLVCDNCICFVHLTCLRRPGTPGDFVDDVFFDYTCEDCNSDNKEVFVRKRIPWVIVLVLTLHHMNWSLYGISNHGFFHYKTHICSFIDRNWSVLFGTQFKQKKNWIGTIAGALSVYNQLFFRSGFNALGESGWWKLLHNFSPAVAAHISPSITKAGSAGSAGIYKVQKMTQDKPKGRSRSQVALDKSFFKTRAAQLGYQNLICNDADLRIPGIEPCGKKRRLDSDELSAVSSTSFYDNLDDGPDVASEEVCMFTETIVVRSDTDAMNEYTPAAVSTRVSRSQSDSSSVHSMQQTHNFYDSESRSGSPIHTDAKPEKIKKTTEEKPIVRRENLFSTQLNSVDLPWIDKVPKPDKNLIEITEYEEIQLLKQVEALIPKVKDQIRKAELHRLKAKLALRRLKRHRRLPIFDLDKTVKILGGYTLDETEVAVNIERVLDRFQRSYLIDNLSGTIANTNYGTVLLSTTEPTTFRSPYSGTILKPYIRRDYKATSTWLNLMDELLTRTHRQVPNYKPPPRAALEYSYVRPHHVAAVNTLCAQFFWPGIDLTETLEYPEFSCVVTYKKLVVGCAFLVPDVSRHEAYISFVLTRPEWRRAKIATFMLYHLLQTCTGKDVTIHVSPTNPAIFLYQKFGFKVEELIQDFYEKYYDIDYKGCRHALFLRLVR